VFPLRISNSAPAAARASIQRALKHIPELDGSALTLRFRPQLTAFRGRLLSGKLEDGVGVHAAAFIRKRRIVLDSALAQSPQKLRLIFVHELFHYVWPRLGNKRRSEYRALLQRELEAGARGELGESAAAKKAQLIHGNGQSFAQGPWRYYVCESFCDTAAWRYAGVSRSADFQLAARWRTKRAQWMEETFRTLRSC
jgi:hypothetical protein